MNEISPTADRRPIKSHPTSPILRHRVPTTDQVLGVASTTSRLHGGRTILTHRPSHSLGQVGAIMSTAHERLQFDQSHASAPASPTDGMTPASLANLLQLSGQRPPMVTQGGEFSTFFENPFGHAHHQHFVRMSNHSARSTSPSVSMASTSITSISPLGNGRLNADSSFTSQEASFDSLSNAASGSISRASSTSEELYFHELGSMGLPASLRINKQKKKLRNIDRKLICEFSEASPNAKQDTIASHFGIERSTVSKILKQKDKWLAIDPDSDLARIAKHRAVKFPAVEDRLANWVARLKSEGTPIKDAMIRQEALNVARELGLGEDKFKASGGWIEKFRERNAIPKPQIKEEAADRGTAEPSPSSQTQPSQATMKQGASTQADQGPAQENPDAETNRELLQTPQKRSRSDLDDQPQTASLSPLNAELDRMQFQAMDAEAVRSMMGHSSHLMDFGQAPQMATMSAQIVSGADAPPGPGISEGMQSPSVPDFEMHEEAACHKRRRAVQRCTPSLSSSSSSSSSQSHVADALGLGPAFNFQFPAPTHILPRPDSVSSSAKLASNAADDELSELKPSDANIGSRGEDSRSNGRGKPRRGPARLARKHHQPQTPSPLRMSPPELPLGSSDSMQPDATSMGQLALATMESLREGLSSTSGSSIVSAEQAQQSLELVLRFLNEQPSNFLPANHFMVFGHLQANIEQLIRERSRPGSSSGDSRSLQTPASTSQSPDGETDDAAAAGQT
ncbi:hypothetical protein BCV70DRAFT_155886 [Testicularia cyperi]|uniref:HTH CENPB-type domain-containing protein n=1 Tax=Testicularia cyperi TaxID=1882483 RepID=A0A317XWD3_9BASI|nr:hypothetical protein BCV70DRAFT_155886 [Testicularia cyperi]